MKAQPMPSRTANEVSVHPLQQGELGEADLIFRQAFGTFLGLPEPLSFMGDADSVRTRWRANPAAAFAAHMGGELVGSSFAANWGTVGVFGPVTVRPDLWDRGIAQRLIEPAIDLFDQWGTVHAGLFTFAQSPRHLALYQKFGFWPRFLTPVLSRGIDGRRVAAPWTEYGTLPEEERAGYLAACRQLTDAIFPGLDLTREICAVQEQGLGETVLLDGEERLEGFAVCHYGPGSEAGSGTCYLKFGAVRPRLAAETDFLALLNACSHLAALRGLECVVAGVNTGRRQAYRQMLAEGFRVDVVGVAMERPDDPGYNRADVYIIDDWR